MVEDKPTFKFNGVKSSHKDVPDYIGDDSELFGEDVEEKREDPQTQEGEEKEKNKKEYIKKLYEWIEWYRSQALPAIPVINRKKCPPKNFPLSSFWDKMPTEEDYKTWREKHWDTGKCGVSIICGQTNTNFFALDIDDRDFFHELFPPEVFEKLKQSTFVTKTGRSYHLWYKAEKGVGRTKNYVFEKNGKKVTIEFIGRKKHIIAPPTIHYTGKIYQAIGIKDIVRVGDAFKDVIEPIIKKAEKLGYKLTSKEQFETKIFKKKELPQENPECVEKGLEGVSQGNRHNALLMLTWYCKFIGLDLEETVETIFEADQKNQPPKYQSLEGLRKEVETVWKSEKTIENPLEKPRI
ncbi:MAG: bifunctional DNA primase/polymerase [Asgard group archaeon]